jgi:predicted AlkP superfamily pyrophosphatase or phosphodiesterase
MNRGPNIFDYLENNRIAYHVSAPDSEEEKNLEALMSEIDAERIDFAFLYWPGLDGLLHRVGNQSQEVPAKLRVYEQWIDRLLARARPHYRDIRLYVFSDHGMANCTELLDLKSAIESLPLTIPADYAVVYDSTMARFWFFNDRARWLVTDCLKTIPQGRIVPEAELERLQAFFPDRYFGELIFLVKEGVLIVPSHMGERPITGMHGYHPDDPQSYAMLCTNQPEIEDSIEAIPDVYRLMKRDADLAKARNAAPALAEEPMRAKDIATAV